jgi:hypothetical protein
MKKRLKMVLLLLVLCLPFQELAAGNWQYDGFIRNNTGIWTQDFDYADTDDTLATFRNWFRFNVNGDLGEYFKLKAEVLAVWEPEYPIEKNSVVPANDQNSFDWRELRLDYYPAPGHGIMLGRQIVNWGEALAGRVGDVINPQDTTFDLGFTNLEDSRIPIWMLRGNHYVNPMNTSLEWIISPYMEADRYRVMRTAQANTIFTNGTFTPGGRFNSYPETRTKALGGLDNMYLYYPGYGVVPASRFGLPILGPPLYKAYQFMPVNAFGPGSPSGNYFLHTPSVKYNYPDASMEDSRWGLRASTTISGTQFGSYFWHGNAHSPVIQLDDGVPTVPGTPLNATITYPSENVFGIFANKSTNYGLLRFDSAFRPSKAYNSMDYEKYPNAIAEKPNLTVQLGYDKSFYLTKLNPSQTFALALEYIGEFVLEDLDDIHVPNYFVEYDKELHLIQARILTNYGYGKYEYQLVGLYYLSGCSLIQPKFTYKPDWMNNKWQFALQYNHLWSENQYTYPLGLKEEKDMILLTTQFSFPN